MVIKHHGLRRAVFIWQGKQQTFYEKKEKDMITNVLNTEQASFGLFGSNVYMENPTLAIAVEDAEPIVNEWGQTLRFALAARNDTRKLADVNARLKAAEPVTVGTSYPNAAKYWLWQLGVAPAFSPKYVQSGGIESLPQQYPALDVIFELVQSGESLRKNNLRLIEDNIVAISMMKVERNVPANISYNGGQDATINPTI